MATYTNATELYDKLVIEYTHNWPSATGIAPAGDLNQIVIYSTHTDGTAPTGTDGTMDTTFGYTSGTAIKHIW